MLALVVLNGDPVSAERLAELAEDADVVISADIPPFLRSAGVVPDYIVGDMDSEIEGDALWFEAKGAVLLRMPPEKDDTDGMLALRLALEKGAKSIVFAGATGGRFDHMYANAMLLLFAREHGAEAVLIGPDTEVSLASGRHTIKGTAGDTLSLLPFMGEAQVTEVSGLQYGKDGFKLDKSVPLGVSNVMISDEASFTVKGMALAVRLFGDL